MSTSDAVAPFVAALKQNRMSKQQSTSSSESSSSSSSESSTDDHDSSSLPAPPAAATASSSSSSSSPVVDSSAPATGNVFSHYYGQLAHQQNMLADHVRTSTYQSAFYSNPSDFAGAAVLDVGTGSGVLAFFAVQAGARQVYAVEMSKAANAARLLVKSNNCEERITVIQGKMEEVDIPEMVDVIVSEPLGFLLVHERMLESFLTARDKWLKPGGKMFPSNSTIFVQPFTDQSIWDEQKLKADFWAETSFYGIDLSALKEQAMVEHFSQPVVGYFHPNILIAGTPAKKFFDFQTAPISSLLSFSVPFSFEVTTTSICHGLACWFDCDFLGSEATIVLSTAPDKPGTHWYQCRLLLRDPLAVNRGQRLHGIMHFTANDSYSYDVKLEAMVGDGTFVPRSDNDIHLQDQHYHYLTSASSAVDSQGKGHVLGNAGQV